LGADYLEKPLKIGKTLKELKFLKLYGLLVTEKMFLWRTGKFIGFSGFSHFNARFFSSYLQFEEQGGFLELFLSSSHFLGLASF